LNLSSQRQAFWLEILRAKTRSQFLTHNVLLPHWGRFSLPRSKFDGLDFPARRPTLSVKEPYPVSWLARSTCSLHASRCRIDSGRIDGSGEQVTGKVSMAVCHESPDGLSLASPPAKPLALAGALRAGLVGNILKRRGLPTAPERQKTTTWKEFIRTHVEVLWVTGFCTTEVLT
jgi:hypothetical protein